MKFFVSFIILIVAVTIVTGFFIVGSPTEERLRKIDDQRVQDLQIIQSEVVNYWVNKTALPKKLSDLENDISSFRAPKDPETEKDYEYSVRGPLTFELCASFVRPSRGSEAIRSAPKPYSGMDNWQHEGAYTCFERTIDKDFYKPIPKR